MCSFHYSTGEKAPCGTLTAANHKVQRDDKEKEEVGPVREEAVLGCRVQPWNPCELFIDEDQSVLESPPRKELSGESPVTIEVGSAEALSLEGKEERGGSSNSEEEMEPSTDEEHRLWHYPRAGEDGEREEATVEAAEQRGEPEGEPCPAGEEQEEIPDEGAQPDVQDGEDGPILASVSRGSETLEPEEAIIKDERVESEVSPLVETLKTEKAIRHSNVDTFHGEREACNEDPRPSMDTFTQTDLGKSDETDVDFKGPAEPSSLQPAEACGRASDRQAVTDNDPAHNPGVVDDMAPVNQCDPPHSDPNEAAQTPSEDPVEEMEGLEPGPPAGGPCSPDGPAHDSQTEEAQPTDGRGIQKKVSFIMEPELINDSLLSEANTSRESQAESSFSGEMTFALKDTGG